MASDATRKNKEMGTTAAETFWNADSDDYKAAAILHLNLTRRDAFLIERIKRNDWEMSKDAYKRSGLPGVNDPRNHVTITVVEPPPPDISDEARAHLGAFAPAKPLEPITTERKVIKKKDDLRAQQTDDDTDERRTITEARAVLGAKLPILQREASQKFAERARPEYAASAGAFGDALIALGNAAIRLNDFHRRHACAQLGWLRPVDTTLFGGRSDPRDRQSVFRRCLTDLAENGYFDLSRIPTEWHSTPAETEVPPELAPDPVVDAPAVDARGFREFTTPAGSIASPASNGSGFFGRF